MCKSANLIDWITSAADGETIEAIVIGRKGWWDEDPNPLYDQILSWENAKPILDYQFDSGFGSPSCHAITAWTKDKVIFISQYDGSTSIDSVPRNPTSHKPYMPGGG